MGQGCTGHPRRSSRSWVTPLCGGLLLPSTSTNQPCSAWSWHGLARYGTAQHGYCWWPCTHAHTRVQARSAHFSPPLLTPPLAPCPPGRAQPGPTEVPGLSPGADEVARSHPCQAGSAHQQVIRGGQAAGFGQSPPCALAGGWQGEPAVPSGEVSAPPPLQNPTWSCCTALTAPTSCPSDPGGDVPPAQPQDGTQVGPQAPCPGHLSARSNSGCWMCYPPPPHSMPTLRPPAPAPHLPCRAGHR